MSPTALAVRALAPVTRGRAVAAVCVAAAVAAAGLAYRSSPSLVAMIDPAGESPDAVERYALPVTPPQDQGDTGLCWVFATLSMLETNYMSRHPGARVEFSRAALQRDSIADRFRRLSRGEPGAPSDGGLPVEALELVRANGLVDRADFHDVKAVGPLFAALREAVAEPAAPAEKEREIDGELAVTLGARPAVTHLGGRAVTPAALARAALAGETWTEFDLARDGAAGWGPSRDPDARAGSQVRYVALDTLVGLIHASLKRGEAVVVGTDDHCVEVYGAEYGRDGKPISYLVKDSLAPHLYRADAGALHRRLNDVTVALDEATVSALSVAAPSPGPSGSL